MKITRRQNIIAARVAFAALVALVALAAASGAARADESEEALAKATQNPIAALISLPLQYNYD